jgi:hypothetical protein
MPKLTSYQKLKLENKNLMQNIFNLVVKENEIEGILTKAMYSITFKINDLIMFGSSESK